MSLASLKSAYSYYEKKDAGFVSAEKTNYVANKNDLTISTVAKGFDNSGNQSEFGIKTSANSFNIGGQGTSRRLQQLGTGTKFPIGPKGQVHEFDIFRGGFSEYRKYEDVYNSLSNAGLADTYTKDSPIDDMYNIVKVRDVASRRDFLRQPFILRGIQRDENSDPQRFGPTINLNLPRAGILTATNRMALDVARIGKFLLSPEGLLFNARQFGQQLMNPNVEGIDGKPGKIFNVNSTKLYTPINLMANIAGGYLGLRTRRHGLLPFGDNPLMPGKYEDVHKSRLLGTSDTRVKNNRLIGLREDLLGGVVVGSGGILSDIQNISNKIRGFDGEVIQRLSGLTGPGSVGGIGATTIRRYTATPNLADIDDLAEKRKEAPLKFENNAENEKSVLKEKLNENDFNGGGTNTNELPATTFDKVNDNIQRTIGNIRSYTTLPYGDIKKITKDRTPSSTKIIDFKTGQEFDINKIPLSFLSQPTDKKIEDIDQSVSDSFIPIVIRGKGLNVAFKGYITALDENIDSQVEIGVLPGTQIPILNSEKTADKSVNISFLIAANNKQELSQNYKQLTDMQKFMASSVSQNVFVLVSIGDLYKSTSFILSSLSINWDVEYPFELTPGEQVPLYLEVTLQLDMLKVGVNSSSRLRYSYKGNQ